MSDLHIKRVRNNHISSPNVVIGSELCVVGYNKTHIGWILVYNEYLTTTVWFKFNDDWEFF